MTDHEKQRIAVMRSRGESYNTIATTLNIPVNSVKSFCRRSHLTGNRTEETISVVSPENDLIDGENRGNTVTAKAPEKPVNTGVKAPQNTYRVKLTFSDTPDEDAIPDILGMLISSMSRRG